MIREDIIKLAREAGLSVGTNISGVQLVGSPAEVGLAHLTIDELERFAALVAAEKEKQIVDILERLHERCGESHNYYRYAICVIKGDI
jgi:hypothetical protein